MESSSIPSTQFSLFVTIMNQCGYVIINSSLCLFRVPWLSLLFLFCSSILSKTPQRVWLSKDRRLPLAITVTQPFLVFDDCDGFEDAWWVFYSVDPRLGFLSDGILMITLVLWVSRRETTDTGHFSSHRIKRTRYQSDLSLLMLTSISCLKFSPLQNYSPSPISILGRKHNSHLTSEWLAPPPRGQSTDIIFCTGDISLLPPFIYLFNHLFILA